MKTIFLNLFIGLSLFFSFACEKDHHSKEKNECETEYPQNEKNRKYKAILDKYTGMGLPGVVVTIKTPENGKWTGSSGFSSIEDSVNLTSCDVMYAASIQKSFISIVILQLIEEGKLTFNTKIESFLTEDIKSCIHNFDKITVEHLLLHTSGLRDVFEDEFINDFFADPMADYSTSDFLHYVKNADPVDEPGKRHYYSDANYMLLSIIINKITGDHFKSVQDRILNPLHLNSSYYRNKDYPMPPRLVESYWESPIDGSFENVSEIQYHLTEQIVGADGLITNTNDLDNFINAVFKGKLVSNNMTEAIKTVKVKNENENWMNEYYGYGFMFLSDEDHGEWIGHSGMHVGAASYVFYNPRNNVSISAMTNVGTFFSEKYSVMFYYELFNDLIKVAFE